MCNAKKVSRRMTTLYTVNLNGFKMNPDQNVCDEFIRNQMRDRTVLTPFIG